MKIKRGILILFLVATFLILRVNALSSSTETQFKMQFTNSYCDYSSDNLGWWEKVGSDYEFSSWDSDDYNCSRDKVEYGLTKCCPISYSCDEDTGKCLEGGEDSCNDFITANDCEDNSNHIDIAAYELSGITECGYESQFGELCYHTISCFCSWNGSECMVSSEETNENEEEDEIFSYPFPDDILEQCSADVVIEDIIGGQCDYKITEVDNCDTTNRKVISWTTTWTGTDTKPTSCSDGETTLTCGEEALLSFFNFANFMISIFAIALIYILFRRNFIKS